jgi:hypothetical protein
MTMTKTIRYEIEMHPDAIDYHRPIPNSWRCTAYSERDEVVSQQFGNGPHEALSEAIRLQWYKPTEQMQTEGEPLTAWTWELA